MAHDDKDRTEKATPKRQQELRSKGQVSKSQDLISGVTLTTGCVLLFHYADRLMLDLQSTAAYTFTHLSPSLINPENLTGLFKPYMSILMGILLPFFLIMAFTGYLVIRIQIGHLFIPDKLKPDFSKLTPGAMFNAAKGMFNIFSVNKIVELLKSFIKMTIVGVFVFNVVMARKDEIFALLGADVSLSFATIGSIMQEVTINVCIILIIIGLIDKKYQDYQHDKSTKMTKEEVKDERKNADGDPKIKAKIKSIQFQMAQQRMMSSIPTADVIVTNPTHYAVALKYDLNEGMAPKVVAKGVDFLAHKIKEIAKSNDVPIVENKPLARTLYKIVPLEGLIPAELYVAVAEVLAYVYKANKDRKR